MILTEKGLHRLQELRRNHESNAKYYVQNHAMNPRMGYDKQGALERDYIDLYDACIELYEQALKEVVP